MAGMWKKTLIYLGLAEDEEYDDYIYEEEEAGQQRQPAIRRLNEPEPVGARREAAAARKEPTARREPRKDAVVRAMPTPVSPRFHLVQPSSFNDAQEIGDKFRDGVSVIMNLANADAELARRLVDFASGLAYGLAGAMQPVADRVFLITPAGVQVSAEERRAFLEERGFFNQA